MKKIMVYLVLALFCFSALAADEIMMPDGKDYNPSQQPTLRDQPLLPYTDDCGTYPAPDFEFVTDPVTIMTSWYDYCPSSYEGYPIAHQTDNGDGYYYTWHASPDDGAATNRRQYWAYINGDGTLNDYGTISTDDVWQGYGNLDIIPATGDPVASWHQNDATLGYGTTMTWDNFSMMNMPGFWATYMFIPPDAPGGNEYIWPYLYVGPAPDEDYVRVYQLGNNYAYSPFGNPCEDIRIIYCDVENTNSTTALDVIMDIDNWTFLYPMYDQWHEKDCRPLSKAFAVDWNNPGTVGFFGEAAWLSGDQGDMPVNPGPWAWLSYDSGSTWDEANLYSALADTFGILYTVDNLPGFVSNSGALLDEVDVKVAGTHCSALFDGEGQLHWPYLQYYGHEEADGFYFFLRYLPQAHGTWNADDGFTFQNAPKLGGEDPSGYTVPWELDPATGDTILYGAQGWSMYGDPGDMLFHENSQKIAVNAENGWMAQIWADGTYIDMNAVGVAGYEDYATHPIIFMACSNDNGETWTAPIEVTDIYNADIDFMNQITAYPYCAPVIEDIGDDWGKITISYMDDNSFGSSIQGVGQNLGGQINYMQVSVDFGFGETNPEPQFVNDISISNFPNPIVSETTINFSAPNTIREASVKVYNTKGQLVKTLAPNVERCNGVANWNGTDMNNQKVANGIYFYTVSTEYGQKTSKMLITR